MNVTLADTGVSGIATMLIVAAVALILGLGALWLARKRSREHAAEVEPDSEEDGDRSA